MSTAENQLSFLLRSTCLRQYCFDSKLQLLYLMNYRSQDLITKLNPMRIKERKDMHESVTALPTTHTLHSFRGSDGVGLEGVEVLVGLGLSGRQARVYLATLKLGEGKVQAIAELSGVHRQEIYRLVDGLIELGLVRRNVSVPVTFSATPISEGVRLLLVQKKYAISAMRQQTKLLIKRYSQPSLYQAAEPVRDCFGCVYEADRGKKYLHSIKTCRHSIKAVTSWRRFKQLSIHFETQLQTALKQDVTIQIYAEKPANHKLPKWVNTASVKYSNFEIKTVAAAPDAGVMIFDHAQVAVAFDRNSSLTKGPDLWSEHPALVTQAQTYFYTVWKQTQNYSTAKPGLLNN
jgi:sugar-specific transcriptional regulator TrmB